ncbi:MAG: DUF2804 family protein [Treponema sp.]
MYSRPISESPKTIVTNGKAVFGTFKNVPAKLDIRGVTAPFGGIPLPSFITNVRIKSRIAYMFSIGDYIGMAEFFDDKMFGLAEIIFWNKTTGKKLAYHTFMTTRRRFIPVKLDDAVCVSFNKSRYIRIIWSRKHDRISLLFSLAARGTRPAVKGSFSAHFSDPLHKELLVVTPVPTTRRCSASWLTAMPIRGSLNILADKKTQAVPMEETDGLAFMVLNRTYYKYHVKSEMMCGLGEYEGKKLVFRFVTTSMDPHEADYNNENVVVLDGQITPMPSVCMTHPFGITNKWIIQDTETMIDLTFTPVSVSHRTLNILIMRTDYNNICGTFDGVLLTGNGDKINLKNFPGIIKKNLLRV